MIGWRDVDDEATPADAILQPDVWGASAVVDIDVDVGDDDDTCNSSPAMQLSSLSLSPRPTSPIATAYALSLSLSLSLSLTLFSSKGRPFSLKSVWLTLTHALAFLLRLALLTPSLKHSC